MGMSSPRVASQCPPLREVHTRGGRPCSRLHASKGSLPSGPGRMKSKSTASSGGTWAGLSTDAKTLIAAPRRVRLRPNNPMKPEARAAHSTVTESAVHWQRSGRAPPALMGRRVSALNLCPAVAQGANDAVRRSRGNYQLAYVRERRYEERGGRHELLRRGEHDGLGGAFVQSALDRRLFGIAGTQTGFGMHAGHAHEVNVGAQARGCIDHGRAHVDHRVTEQAASQHDDVHVRLFGRFHSHRGAVGDDGGAQVGLESTGDLQRGGAAIQDNDLAGPNHRGTQGPELELVFGRYLLARS